MPLYRMRAAPPSRKRQGIFTVIGFGAGGTIVSRARALAAGFFFSTGFFFVALVMARCDVDLVDRADDVACFIAAVRALRVAGALVVVFGVGDTDTLFGAGAGAGVATTGATATAVAGAATAAFPAGATVAADATGGATPADVSLDACVTASVALGAIFSPNSPWITGFAIHS